MSFFPLPGSSAHLMTDCMHHVCECALGDMLLLRQDPTNRQFVLADDPLKKLFGEERFKAFGLQKYLSPHLTKL